MSARASNRRHSLVVVLALLGLGLITLLSYYLIYVPHLRAEATVTQRSTILMDTVVDVRVDGRNSEQLVQEAFATMAELENTLSRFVGESEIAKINGNAGEWVEVSTTTLEVIELGIAVGDLTAGAFDITMGAVLDLWDRKSTRLNSSHT